MNIKRFLALAAMMLGVGFFGASQAQAQVTTIPVTKGGVTCQKVIGGSYPEDGHVFRCTSSTQYNNEIQSRPRNILNGSWGANNMKARFQSAGVEFYAFDDAVAAMSFLDNLPPSGPTPAQREAYFNTWAGKAGFSPDPSITQRAVVVFKNVGIAGTYPPGNTASQNITDFSHTIVHEMGHNYDFLTMDLAIPRPSYSSEFNRVAQIDHAYFQANDPNYATHNVNGKYWLQYNKGLTPPPDDHWSELFAEDFAKHIHGSAGSNPAAEADSVIAGYYTCTMRYVYFMLNNNRAPIAGTTDYNTARCR